MKNTFKLLGILILAMAIGFTACDDGSDPDGQLIITGIPGNFNDNYAFVISPDDSLGDYMLMGGHSVTMTTITCSRISNGRATFNLYYGEENYSGNHQNVGIEVFIINKQLLTVDDLNEINIQKGLIPDWFLGVGIAYVNFSNGNGQGIFELMDLD